jgi:glucose/arabinose dehydrogenase
MKYLFLSYSHYFLLVIFAPFFLFVSFNSIGYSSDNNGMPILVDSNLKVEPVFRGSEFLTSMTFLGPDDILVLEKDNGTVQRITNGTMSKEPLIDIDVSYKTERGMLGIALPDNQSINVHKYVFLYYTKSETNHDEDIVNSTYKVSDYLYRYELVNDSKLLNPKLLLSTPPTKEIWLHGGYIQIGPDNNVYVTTGDVIKFNMTQAQNNKEGTLPDLMNGIIRITQNGEALQDDILGNTYPLNLYYAYGIRNSFGIDFDPVTGKLWDTENGPQFGDEINLVEPGFNSGWSRVQGTWTPWFDVVKGGDAIAADELPNPDNNELVNFNGKGKYSAPEFIWKQTVGPTAIKFLDSDKYGNEYKYDLFVGDVNNGYLYHFDLNKDRSGLDLRGPLEDRVADTNSDDELDQIKFGEGFGPITDMKVGPDGYLYILSNHNQNNTANIFKIIPLNSE